MKQWFDNISASKTLKMLKDSVLCCGHPYVEIGGVKWATMNIGANSVTDCGLYFQFGDTQGHTAAQVGYGEGQKYFGWKTYKYGNSTNNPSATSMTKYNNTDGLTTLEDSDDAVTAAWGGSWRTPTLYEFDALRAAVTTKLVANYQGSGVSGMVLTDKTDSSKELFFPACGYAYEGIIEGAGYSGLYWSGSLSANCGKRYAYYVFLGSDFVNWHGNGSRCYGLAVRGVLGC